MSTFDLVINGTARRVDVDPRTPLLWVLRDALQLTGTKFGCGVGACGACTVHLDGRAARACLVPASSVGAKRVTTIEGFADGERNPLLEAWIEEDVPQCGYCQAGQIMSAAALLRDIPDPTDEDIDRAMQGNLCRCGTYGRIRAAIHRAAAARSHAGL